MTRYKSLGVGLFCGALILMSAAALAVYTTMAYAGGTLFLGGTGFLGGFWWYRRMMDRELTLEGRTLARLTTLVRDARRVLGRTYRRAPVYLVMGDAQVGKSALLRALDNSHGVTLESAPAPENQSRVLALHGSLFLEVPSHLMHADASLSWQSFVVRLRRLGWGARVRGVLVVLDAQGVQKPPSDDQWSPLLTTLVRTLRVRAPTYLLINRCDAIPGFTETFERLPADVRDAPWGFAVDDSDETALTTGHRFDALLDTLRAFSMATLAVQDSRTTRAPLYLFPQYVSMLRRGLCAQVERIFGTQAQDKRPRLGGVYLMAAPGVKPHDALIVPDALTMVTPSAWTPLALQSGAQNLPLEAQAVSYVSEAQPLAAPWSAAFFVRQFAQTVLANDRNVFITVAHPGLRGQWAQSRWHVLTGISAFILLVLATVGFFSASQNVHRALAIAATPFTEIEQPSDALLEKLAQEVTRTREQPAWIVWQTLGLSDSALKVPLANLYVRLMDREMVGALLQEDTVAMQASWQRHAYSGTAPLSAESTRLSAQLRAHLLLTQPKAEHEPHLVGRHADVLVHDLAARCGDPQCGDEQGSTSIDVRRHLALYVAILADHPTWARVRDQQMVSRSRALLAKVPLADRLIDQLAHDVSFLEPALRLDDVVATSDVPLYAKLQVPAVFTRQGYLVHAKAWLRQEETDSDSWIYWAQRPTPAQRQELVLRVRSRYFSRYIEAWRDFVDQLTWQQPQEVQDGHGMLLALTRSEPPPLRALWRALANNTQLETHGADALPQSVLGGLRRRLHAVAQDDNGDEHADRPIRGAQDVEAAFRALVMFGGAARSPEAEAQAPLSTYQEILSELRVGVEAYLESPQEADAMLQQLRRARHRAVGLIGAAPQGPMTHSALHRLLIVPLDHMTRALTRGARSEVGALWCPAVVQPFAHLAQNYPLDPYGADASLDDFSAYFRPGQGQPWAFYTHHLSQDMVQRVNTFVFDEKLGGALKHTFNARLLGYYDHLFATSRALFAGEGSPVLGADFQVRVVMDKELWETTLTLHNKVLHVAPGQQASSWQTMHWPPSEAEQSATTLAMVGVGGVREQIDFDGVWGLWRLLESGQVSIDKASGMITVLYRPGGLLGHARVEIRPKRRNNLFFLAGVQGARGGLFAYLRDTKLRPPRSMGTKQVPCPS